MFPQLGHIMTILKYYQSTLVIFCTTNLGEIDKCSLENKSEQRNTANSNKEINYIKQRITLFFCKRSKKATQHKSCSNTY